MSPSSLIEGWRGENEPVSQKEGERAEKKHLKMKLDHAVNSDMKVNEYGRL